MYIYILYGHYTLLYIDSVYVYNNCYLKCRTFLLFPCDMNKYK